MRLGTRFHWDDGSLIILMDGYDKIRLEGLRGFGCGWLLMCSGWMDCSCLMDEEGCGAGGWLKLAK